MYLDEARSILDQKKSELLKTRPKSIKVYDHNGGNEVSIEADFALKRLH